MQNLSKKTFAVWVVKIAKHMGVYDRLTSEEWKNYADYHYPYYLESSWNEDMDPLDDGRLKLFLESVIENEILGDVNIFYTHQFQVYTNHL